MVRAAVVIAALLAGCGNLDPYFESVLEVGETSDGSGSYRVIFDSSGPYRIETYVNAPRGIEKITLKVADADASPESVVFGDLAFTFESGDERRGRWATELLGRPVGAGYTYFLLLQDRDGYLVRYPPGAPEMLLGFRVLEPPL